MGDNKRLESKLEMMQNEINGLRSIIDEQSNLFKKLVTMVTEDHYEIEKIKSSK